MEQWGEVENHCVALVYKTCNFNRQNVTSITSKLESLDYDMLVMF